MTGFDCVWQHWIVLASHLLCNLCISCQWRAARPRAPFRCREINIIDNRKWRDANLRKITNWLLCWAVIFDRPNLTASLAAIFVSVQVVFLDCPFLDCLNHGVTTLTVGVTTFTNHSEKECKCMRKSACKCYLTSYLWFDKSCQFHESPSRTWIWSWQIPSNARCEMQNAPSFERP